MARGGGEGEESGVRGQGLVESGVRSERGAESGKYLIRNVLTAFLSCHSERSEKSKKCAFRSAVRFFVAKLLRMT